MGCQSAAAPRAFPEQLSTLCPRRRTIHRPEAGAARRGHCCGSRSTRTTTSDEHALPASFDRAPNDYRQDSRLQSMHAVRTNQPKLRPLMQQRARQTDLRNCCRACGLRPPVAASRTQHVQNRCGLNEPSSGQTDRDAFSASPCADNASRVQHE